MKWTAPPTRREITIVLFALTTFVLSYNIESSLRLVGLDGLASQGITARLWRGKGGVIDKDGRKPRPWRDRLENQIFGDWRWDEGHVSGDGKERQQEKGEDRYGAIWTGKVVTPESARKEQQVFGGTRASDYIVPWGDEVAQTRIVQHIPGYTIFDNVVLVNGTMLIITDDPDSFPPLASISSSSTNPNQPPLTRDWQIWTTGQVKERLGECFGDIHGVTFMSADKIPNNRTLISLWRTYSSLDPNISSTGLTALPAPRRLIFPLIPTFSDPLPEDKEDVRRRVRSFTGFHPQLIKAAFPTLGVMYTQDWTDFVGNSQPFRFERLVLADRGAAARATTQEQPVFAGPFEQLEGSQYWWEPIRRTLVGYLGVKEEEGKGRSKGVVTYIMRQGETRGPRLRDADHRALVEALRKMAHDYGYEVNFVSEKQTKWDVMMTAIVRSTIVLGVYGPHLTDSIYMKPSPNTTLMEFFPSGTFTRDQQVAARALGTRYIAWQNERQFNEDSLPTIFRPDYARPQEITLDVPAVIQALRDTLSH